MLLRKRCKTWVNNNGSEHLNAIKGIIFTDSDNGFNIINYPKVHYDNGVNKNQGFRTNSNYKSTVRIFRNIKASLVMSGAINSNLAPSYFVECLIYNGNDNCFSQNTFQLRAYELLKQFFSDFADNSVDNYVCQNEQRILFGNGAQQWYKQDAKTFLDAVLTLWNK